MAGDDADSQLTSALYAGSRSGWDRVSLPGFPRAAIHGLLILSRKRRSLCGYLATRASSSSGAGTARLLVGRENADGHAADDGRENQARP